MGSSSNAVTRDSARQLSTRKKKASKTQMAKAYSVLYDSSDHLAVLTQLWGSVWPRVSCPLRQRPLQLISGEW